MFCRKCGTEFQDANFCPKCGQPVNATDTPQQSAQSPTPPIPATKKKKKGPVIAIVVIAVLVFIFIVGAFGEKDTPVSGGASGSSSSAESQPSGSASSDASSEDVPSHGVNDPVEVRGVTVTMTGVSESMGQEFNQPSEGNVFVIVDFAVENNSDKEINVSSLVDFDAYCDDYAVNVSISASAASEDKELISGTVAPGKKLNGTLAYEVPADMKVLEIDYQPSLFVGDKIRFVYEK